MSESKSVLISKPSYSRHLRKTLPNKRREIRKRRKKESLMLTNLRISF